MNEGEALLGKANPVLVGMFNAAIKDRVTTDLGSDKYAVAPATIERMQKTKKEDALHFLKSEVEKDTLKKQASIDSLTELKTPRVYWKDLSLEVSHGLQLKHENPDDELTIVRFDLGMLTTVNSIALHSGGDAYKRYVASHLVNPMQMRSFKHTDELVETIFDSFSYFDAYIVGGDEFALIMKGKPEKVIEYMQLLHDRLTSDKSHVLRLLPNKIGVKNTDLLDWGTVTLNEETRADFLKLNDEFSQGRYIKGKIKRCAIFLNDVADTKSDIAKMYKRIHFLVQVFKQNNYEFPHEIQTHWQSITKATGGINQQKISAFADAKDLDDEIRQYVIVSIQNRGQETHEKSPNDFSTFLQPYLAEKVAEYIKAIPKIELQKNYV